MAHTARSKAGTFWLIRANAATTRFCAGGAATANGLSSAELAAKYPQSGGTYEYGYRVLNPWLGFTAGWMFLASKIAAAGTVALGLAGYLEMLVPGLNPRAVAP